MGCAGLPIGATPFSVTNATADATTGMIVKAATVGKTLYLTDIVISTDTATTIEVQDTASTVVAQHMYFPAVSIWSKTWSTPLILALGTGLKVIAADAGNVTCTISGFLR
jgi:hypothetical protein